ncbi:type II toxin-antitoxin system VapC family toxin [Magnetovirga frankeli]|uniref:PIN domain-containing protein n=1 Tax=Magnetovirga frankeli TaxID=947516 RepID=UPI0012939776|nr:type II toxin-antitoxin system VapC family toxin [gamma proteobacterium SS-5]
MKAIDTNVLVRFLVNDDPEQAERVRQLFAIAEQQRDAFYVSLIVLLETIWVLESAYQIQRTELIDALADLLLMPVLQFEQREAVQAMLNMAINTNLDLPDALIAQSALLMGCDSVLTFDQKAARHLGFERLEIP